MDAIQSCFKVSGAQSRGMSYISLIAQNKDLKGACLDLPANPTWSFHRVFSKLLFILRSINNSAKNLCSNRKKINSSSVFTLFHFTLLWKGHGNSSLSCIVDFLLCPNLVEEFHKALNCHRCRIYIKHVCCDLILYCNSCFLLDLFLIPSSISLHFIDFFFISNSLLFVLSVYQLIILGQVDLE